MELFFKNNGYAIFDFFSESDIDNLSKKYKKINPEIKSEFFSTIDSQYELKIEINNVLRAFFSSFIKDVFINRDYIFGCFAIKQKGAGSMKSFHQDWSLVDETKSSGIGVWCPLNDVNIENGCLGVIPGSHNYLHNYRGTGTRSEYEEVASYMESKLFKFIPMKKGQVVVFDSRMIHFSRPNFSLNERIAATCVVRDKSENLVHFVRNREGTKIQKRVIDNSFFMNENFSKIEFIENEGYPEIAHNFKAITKSELHELITKYDTRLLIRLKYKLISVFNLSC